ncbi:hypothetical protein [Streptomyces sp. NBC_01235]|uniref:hypothetical protein n=1 Tax=Streptomyces sp. NBC_01235 TaxID=2903788 RepID=UPI002E0F5698|nr:hypothetical protein OG289_38480 [Streptomyces sp. NBC_01235]
MHDDRPLVQARPERVMRRLVRPARYGAHVPPTLFVGHVEVGSVPVDRALPGRVRAAHDRHRAGKVLVDEVVPVDRTGARGAGGRLVGGGDRPQGLSDDGPGFHAEGTVHDGAGVPLNGVHPRNRHPTITSSVSGGEPVHPRCEADADPAAPHPFERTHPGYLLTAWDRTVHGFAPADLAVVEEEVGQLVPDGGSAPTSR